MYPDTLQTLIHQKEFELLNSQLEHLRGLNLLLLGDNIWNHPMTKPEHIPLLIACKQQTESCYPYQVCANLIELPFLSDSIDIIVAPHTLKNAKANHLLIKEIWRILRPEGHAIFTGHNAMSLARFIYSKKPSVDMSLFQLRKLLIQENFEILEISSYIYSTQKKLNQYLEVLFHSISPYFGALYFLIAKKEVYCPTPLRFSWSLENRLGIENVKPQATHHQN